MVRCVPITYANNRKMEKKLIASYMDVEIGVTGQEVEAYMWMVLLLLLDI